MTFHPFADPGNFIMATVCVHPLHEEFAPHMLNMYVLKRYMDEHNVDVQHMWRKGNGDIYLRVSSVPGEDFFGLKDINDVPVKINLPPDLNCILGVIHHPELAYLNDVETCELLSGEDADSCYQVLKLPGKAFAIISWIITVRSTLPDTVKLGWETVKVKPARPRPVRCYRCQLYGHMAADCKRTPVCPHCSGEHRGDECKNSKKCPACSGSHSAYDPQCPAWVEETAVAKIKKQDQLSYRDAVKKRKNQKEEERKKEEKKKEEEEERKKEEKKNEEKKKEEEEESKKERTTKRKIQQEPSDESTEEEQEEPEERQQEQSGQPGEWHLVTSRKKKK